MCVSDIKLLKEYITGPMVNHTKRDGFVVNSGCRFNKYDLLARIKKQLIDCVIWLNAFIYDQNDVILFVISNGLEYKTNGKRQQILSGVYQNILKKHAIEFWAHNINNIYFGRSFCSDLFNHQVFLMLQAIRKIKLTINLYSWSDPIMM